MKLSATAQWCYPGVYSRKSAPMSHTKGLNHIFNLSKGNGCKSLDAPNIKYKYLPKNLLFKEYECKSVYFWYLTSPCIKILTVSNQKLSKSVDRLFFSKLINHLPPSLLTSSSHIGWTPSLNEYEKFLLVNSG